MKAVIVGAADDFVPFRKRPGDIVIAADGGYAQPGVADAADIVIGDFDSLGYEPRGAETVRLPVEKDVTDTAAAAQTALEKGCGEMEFYGVLGGKLDHALANLQLGVSLAEKGVKTVFRSKGYDVMFVCDGTLPITGRKGARVSVFSFGKSEGVTLEGLKYKLEDATLLSDFALGVSNSFEEEHARVTVGSGTLAVFVYEESDSVRS